MLTQASPRGSGLLPSVVAVVALLSGCTAESEPVYPTVVMGIPVAQCLDGIALGSEASACPGFVAGALADAALLCRDVGGRPIALESPTVWAIDVNSDGRNEYAFELDGIVSCESAWSVYSCGSLGCPKARYEERDGAWQVIGAIHASEAESVAFDTSAAASGYHPFHVGCEPGPSCEESWQYSWRDGYYEARAGVVRGHRVDIEGSVHGLHALLDETAMLAEPRAGAAALDVYAAGVDVAIIGTADGAPFYYVSPCNACASGFIPVTAVAAQ